VIDMYAPPWWMGRMSPDGDPLGDLSSLMECSADVGAQRAE